MENKDTYNCNDKDNRPFSFSLKVYGLNTVFSSVNLKIY